MTDKIRVKDLPVFKVTEEEARALKYVFGWHEPFLCIRLKDVQDVQVAEELTAKISKALRGHYTLAGFLKYERGYSEFETLRASVRDKWINKILRYNNISS
jgi:hypothetical protein